MGEVVPGALQTLMGRQEEHLASEVSRWFVDALILLDLCTSYSSSRHHHLHHP